MGSNSEIEPSQNTALVNLGCLQPPVEFLFGVLFGVAILLLE
jgi:hypothetical protein